MLKLLKKCFPIVFVVFFLLSNSIFSQKLPELIPIKVDGKFGYCDSNKKIIIEPRFDDAYPFNENDIALIEIDNLNGLINKNGKYVIYPGANSILLHNYYKSKWIAVIDIENDTDVSNESLIFKHLNGDVDLENGLNIISKKGEILTRDIDYFDKIISGKNITKEDTSIYTYIVFSKNDKQYIINDGGKYFAQDFDIIDYEDREHIFGIKDDRLIQIKLNNKNKKFFKLNSLRDVNLVATDSTLSDYLMWLKFENVGTIDYHLFNLKAKTLRTDILDYGYTNDYDYFKGELKVKHYNQNTSQPSIFESIKLENNSWIFIDEKGNKVFEKEFEDVRSFSDGLAAVKTKSGKWGFINNKGEFILGPKFNYEPRENNKGYIPIKDNYNGKWGIIKLSNKYKGGYSFVLPVKYETLTNLHNTQLYNKEKEAVSNKEKISRFAVVSVNDKWGVINQNFKLDIPISYDAAGIIRNNLLPVKKRDKWGIITTEGEKITDFIYEQIAYLDYDLTGSTNLDADGFFTDGYIFDDEFLVSRGDGFFKKESYSILDLDYLAYNGIVRVKSEKFGWYYVDTQGNKYLKVTDVYMKNLKKKSRKNNAIMR